MTEMETPIREKNSDKIYFRRLRTVLRGPGKQERRAEITVNVEVQQAVSALFRQALLIRLTDDNDAFFLLTLKIVEEDFQILKSQQGLLVDFVSFPQKFIDLLEQCRQEENKDTPRFLLSLVVPTSSPALLEVVETNPFKHLVHLSLQFSAGSDSDIKSYLAGCLKSLKSQKERLERESAATETELRERLRECRERLAVVNRELEDSRRKTAEDIESLRSRLLQEMAVERDKALQSSSELQYRHEREMRDSESSHRRTAAQLETAESRKKDLEEKCNQLETVNAESRRKSSCLEEELKTERRENSRLRQETTAAASAAKESERAYSQLETRASVAEQELRAHEQKALKQQNIIDRLQEQKQRCEEESERRKQAVAKREDAVKTLSEEVQKGNDIIRKLQTEVRSQQAKLKVRNRITSEQEKVIADKDAEVGKLSKESCARLEDVRAKDTQIASLTRDLESARAKLEESDRIVKTNENVINWLNKQLNQTETNRKDLTTALNQRPFDYSSMPRSNVNTSPALGSLPRPLKPTTQVRYSPNAVPWVPSRTSQANTETRAPVSTGLDAVYLQPAQPRTDPSPTNVNSREGPRLPRALISPVTPISATTPSSYFPPPNA